MIVIKKDKNDSNQEKKGMYIEITHYQHLNISSPLNCVCQQFKKAILDYGQQKLWPIASTTKAGNIRGYTGIALQRPRREPAVEFGGRIMAERIQHYMSLNPKPTPPIEVSSYTYSYIYLVLSLEIKPVAAMLNSMFIFQASRCAQ